MFILEKIGRVIRHLPVLNRLDFFWNLVTPAYEFILRFTYKGVLRRVVNNSDVIYIPQRLRHLADNYETDFWKIMMQYVREGDTVADVGAFLGFYTFAFAKRAGRGGKVIAFEPDPDNLSFLRGIVKRYKIVSTLEIAGLAVGDKKGVLSFDAQSTFTSTVILGNYLEQKKRIEVDSVTLDGFFNNQKLDILKIDVEGYEGKVLSGARNILQRRKGYPRAVFIEVHPYAWNNYETTDKMIMCILKDSGYRVIDIQGRPIEGIKDYGDIIALRDS